MISAPSKKSTKAIRSHMFFKNKYIVLYKNKIIYNYITTRHKMEQQKQPESSSF